MKIQLNNLSNHRDENCIKTQQKFLEDFKNKVFPFTQYMEVDINKYQALQKELIPFGTIVILGIGGSALGTKMLYYAFPKLFRKKIYVLDTTDPNEIALLLNKINWDSTLFISISKSGSTIETAALTLFFIGELEKRFDYNWKKHIVFITDPIKGDLRSFVEENKLLSLEIPSNLGGRYSVLSNVGMFPLYLAGFPIDELLNGSKEFYKNISNENMEELFMLSCQNFEMYKKNHNILVLFPYIGRLKLFGEWFVQLYAESLGKKDKNNHSIGQTPIITVGPTDQHSIIQLFNEGPNDKVILFIKEENHKSNFIITKYINRPAFSYLKEKSFAEILDIEYEGTMDSLTTLSIPNATLIIDELTPKEMGKMIMFFYVFTVFMSFLLQVNPFDQPGVENGKKIMYKKLGREGY